MSAREVFHRFAGIVLPVLSVGAIAYAGSVIYQNSHAQDLGGTGHYAAATDSSCCRLEAGRVTVSEGEMRRVSLPLTITNNSKSTVLFSPGLQLMLFDANGQSYPYTARYLAAGATAGGPIVSGKTFTQQVDFDIPPNTTPRALSFQENASTEPVMLGVEP